MLSEDIRNVAASLGVLSDQVPEKQWALIRAARKNLRAVADQVAIVEKEFVLATVPATLTAQNSPEVQA